MTIQMNRETNMKTIRPKTLFRAYNGDISAMKIVLNETPLSEETMNWFTYKIQGGKAHSCKSKLYKNYLQSLKVIEENSE
jgi:hypothetical protein